MAEEKLTREKCIDLLTNKQKEIALRGEKRYPYRSDFSDREVTAVKAFLGPWPRALEAAGLKEKRDDDKEQKRLQKRILKKREHIEELKKRKKVSN